MNNQTTDELKKRDLDSCYFSILCLPTKVYIKEDDGSINVKDMYTFFGCNLLGVRKFICNVISNDFSKTSDWYNFILNLKNRNLEQVFYVVIPNNKSLKDAFKLVFKDAEIFINCYEAINKLFKYYTCSYTTSIYELIRNIYLSENLVEYEAAVIKFNESYIDSPFIIDLLDGDIKNAKSYYSIPNFIRKHIFSFYYFRDTLKKFIVISHSKDYFNNEDEFTNLLIPIIKITEKRMYSTKKEWVNVINYLYSNKKELIKSYL